MGWVTGLAIFFVIWWTVLFAVLPFGVRSQIEEGEVVPGSADGAPARPRMLRKIIQTTIVSLIVFALYYLVTEIIGVGVDDLPNFVPNV